jgi:hypothetical protein
MKKAMIVIMAVISCSLMAATVWADPPANDLCANATDAGILAAGIPVQLAGTTAEATQDCMMGVWPEVWIKFTVPSCMDVTIDFCNDNNQINGPATSLFTDCSCNASLNSQSYTTCSHGSNPIITWNNLAAGTYYYPIYNFVMMNNPYTVNITGTACPPPPANDNCSDAISIGEVTEMPFTTRSATLDGGGSCITSGSDIWYIYTPTVTDTIRISLCGSEYNTMLAVYDGGSCSQLPSLLGCNDNACGLQSQLDIPVIMGNQYLVEIGGANDESGSGVLTIGEVPVNPPNDDCENATDAGTLVMGVPVQLTGTTVGATQGCLVMYPAEVWIKFTLAGCMNVTIDFCDDAHSIIEYTQTLYGDCSCSNITYPNAQNWDCGKPAVSWYNLEPGTYYYAIPQPYSGGTSYTINIVGSECPVPPTPDFIVTAPYSGTNTTCGAGDDCYMLHAGQDRVYEVTIPSEGNWIFSLCNSSSQWSSYLALGSSMCESDFGSNVSGCGMHAKLTVYNLAAGVYYLLIGSQHGECGDYILDINRQPYPCENSYYTNGDANMLGGLESYRDGNTYKFAADDFTLTENITLDSIKFMCSASSAFNFNLLADYRIMEDSDGVPGAILFEGTGMASTRNATGMQYNNDDVYTYQINNLGIELTAGSYFIAYRPVESRSTQINYWLTTSTQTGSTAYTRADDNSAWVLSGLNSDLAFCIFATTAGVPCVYLPGDINGDNQRIGGDVTYGVRYFKGTGGVPPDSCYMDSTSAYLYVSGDVNGNCEFRGSDITRLVAFFKGTAQLSYCHFFPPPVLRNDKAIAPKLSGEN